MAVYVRVGTKANIDAYTDSWVRGEPLYAYDEKMLYIWDGADLIPIGGVASYLNLDDLVDIALSGVTEGQIIRFDAAGDGYNDDDLVDIPLVFNGVSGSDQQMHRFNYDAVIVGWALLANAAGDITIDVWKDTFANFPPDNSDTITAANEPALSSAQSGEDTTLSGWTTAIASGDCIIANVDSVTTITDCALILHVRKT